MVGGADMVLKPEPLAAALDSIGVFAKAGTYLQPQV